MPTEIGSFEAKTHLAEILRKVEQGESFTITRRGKVIAEINPPGSSRSRAVHQAAENLRNFPRLPAVPHETIRAWIEEGRE